MTTDKMMKPMKVYTGARTLSSIRAIAFGIDRARGREQSRETILPMDGVRSIHTCKHEQLVIVHRARVQLH